ncbi:MAG TPA: isoprenylcysteine carboxylmethyltransferase family protein [Balneolales bacterium]|nr:isoprenylcysteine carboxylmethyltransferase family protein [Balneolales bacterium]
MTTEWIYSISGLILFAILHSFLAGHSLKRRFFNRWPKLKPFYRVFYNLFSLLYLVLWFIFIPPPDIKLYSIPIPYAYIFILIQLMSLYLILKSAREFGTARFFGIPQVKAYFRYGKLPEYYDEMRRGELVTRGIYKWVRHPLYTFSLLLLISSPVMTTRLLAIIIFGILYFYIGSIYEERKLIERFGESYKKYQRDVPRLIPWKIPKK